MKSHSKRTKNSTRRYNLGNQRTWGRHLLLLILLVFNLSSASATNSTTDSESIDFDNLVITKKELPKEYQNICLNKHPGAKGMKNKEKLKEFAKGPCSPVILLPGLMGSKLRIQIDCYKFKKHHHKVFHHCGWRSCTNRLFRPRKEYTIWIPGISSTSKGFLLNKYGCFTELLKLRLKVTKKGGLEVRDTWKTGFRILPYTLTQKTSRNHVSDCGGAGVRNLVSGLSNIRLASYYRQIISNLKQMGYTSGLTLQAVPYDWRLNNELDPVVPYLTKLIKFMSTFVNKKVVIVAHSMGNIRALAALYKMTQHDKDRYVRSFVAIGAPFLGVPELVLQSLCGSEKFSRRLFGVELGISPRSFKKAFSSMVSVYDLFPAWTFWNNRREEWLQKIIKRQRYENGRADDPIFEFLPPRSAVCYPYSYWGPKFCRSGLYRYWNLGDIMDSTINPKDHRRILQKYSWFMDHKIMKISLKKKEKSEFYNFPNPGVQVNLVYSSAKKSIKKYYIWKKLLKEEASGKYCEMGKDFKFVYTRGDHSVPAVSSLVPALKWALEFESQEAKNHGMLYKKTEYKAVKIIDLCQNWPKESRPLGDGNLVRGSQTIWDKTLYTKPFKTLKNEFLGLNQCSEQPKYTGHTDMLLNDKLSLFLMDILDGNDRVMNLDPKVENRFSVDDIEIFVDKCYLNYGLRKLVYAKMGVNLDGSKIE